MRKMPELQSKQQPSDYKQQHAGHNLHHESAVLHVTGKARYVDDLLTPANVLHAYVGMAEQARATITHMNLQPVRQMVGVVDVITIADVPGHTDIGPVFPGDPILAPDQVQFYGQPLFAVLANSYHTARCAAQLAQVEYVSQQPILDETSARAQQATVRPPHTMQRGEWTSALKQAPQRLQIEQCIGGQEHFYLEGQVALAYPAEQGGVTVYSSTQHPTEVQKLVAEVLGLAMHRVVVDTRRMGGGFGGKETQAAQWACLAAVLAVRNQRPVKLRLARRDDMVLTGKRHPFINRADIGFNDQGELQALKLEFNGLCGCSPDLSDAIVDRAMFHADNAYFLPAVQITGHRWLTHTTSNTAYRGFGGPQGMMLIEQVMDDIARRVGRDPLNIRLDNLYSGNDRNLTPYHQTVSEPALERVIRELADTSDYWTRRDEISNWNRQSRRYKRGLALTPVKFGISFTVQHLNQAGALLHVYIDGSIQINHGGTEMGQGLHTKVAQIVAAELGVEMETVEVTSTRTDKVPNTSPTAASSGTDINGQASRNAALTIKNRLIDFLQQQHQAKAEDVVFANQQVTWNGHSMSFAELCQAAYMARISLSATGYYRTPKIHYDRSSAAGQPFFYYACGAAVSEVEVDTLTGMHHLRRVDILHDVGNSINPALDQGQIEGGFIQGLGWLTTEELVWSNDGRLQTDSGASYKIPAIGDTPTQFNVQLLTDSPNQAKTVFRSKAVGEPPFMLAISVWSALRDAISSLDDYRTNPSLDTPATPERVLWALQSMDNHGNTCAKASE
jgi:xanthine dehydrogenase large subunit